MKVYAFILANTHNANRSWTTFKYVNELHRSSSTLFEILPFAKTPIVLVFTFTYPLFYFFNSINKKKINKFKKIK
jgi:hypothetical protein